VKKFNLLNTYPNPKAKRYVNENIRTIKNRINASYREREFYDGKRNDGMGGFYYDGRWIKIADKICKKYNLNNNSSILQLGAQKGFLLHDIKNKFPKIKIVGLDYSNYAINKAMKNVKRNIKKVEDYTKLNFKTNYFDFVIALGVVYEYDLTRAISTLKEIQRVSKGNSFITLGSYNNQKEYVQLKQWTLLGTTLLKEKEWRQVMKHVKFTGDYDFVNAKKLNLVTKK
jgi:hypothetical protein